jgi:hypothetical protein
MKIPPNSFLDNQSLEAIETDGDDEGTKEDSDENDFQPDKKQKKKPNGNSNSHQQ